MSGFYLTLPSNSSMTYYPNNTLTNFVTRLPKLFDLKGQWEVGLVEIHYPHTWYNIPNNCAITVASHVNTDNREIFTFDLEAGYYTTSELLTRLEENALKAMNLTKNNATINLTYDPANQTYTSHLQGYNMDVGSHIQRLLGMNQTFFTNGIQKFIYSSRH